MVLNADDSFKTEAGTFQEDAYTEDCLHSSEPVLQTKRSSKGRIIRNTIVLSLAYFLFFSGFWALSNLQSTMNAEQGMGVDSQAVIYLCSLISCFLPELLMDKFGTKTTFVITLLLSCPYIAANFSPRWDTMMVSSVIYGMVSGPRNAAMTVYLDEMSSRYKDISGESRENATAFCFGLFMFFAQFTEVVGNAVSYYILLKGHSYSPPPRNFSVETECGIHFDPNAANVTNTNLDPPSDHDRYLVIGIFLTFGLLSVVDALFVDPLGNDMKEVKGCRMVSQKIISTVKQLKNPHQLLLLPFTIYLGMEGSFYAADYTQAFIACSWGVHHVGFVSICFGVCGAVTGIFGGPLVKCLTQMSVILIVAFTHVVACALLFVWQPSPEVPIAYFVFAGIWGVADAVLWSQIGALYGLVFHNNREAAYSNFFFWTFFGHFISYSYTNYFTVRIKLIILIVFLTVGIFLYLISQIKIKCFSPVKGFSVLGEPQHQETRNSTK